MISNSLAIALIVLFLHSLSWEGMIFEKIKKLIDPETSLSKPVYGCPICMTPYWGSALYWLLFHNDWIDWLVTVGVASGMSVVSVILLYVKDYCTKAVDEIEEDKYEIDTDKREIKIVGLPDEDED